MLFFGVRQLPPTLWHFMFAIFIRDPKKKRFGKKSAIKNGSSVEILQFTLHSVLTKLIARQKANLKIRGKTGMNQTPGRWFRTL